MAPHITGKVLSRQIYFWLFVLALFIAFLWLFSSILLPFVAGMAMAYFLDPVADRLQAVGLSRLAATAVILLSSIVLLVVALIIIVPSLAAQAVDFGAKVPGYVTQLQHMVTDSNSHLVPAWLKAQMGNIKDDLSKYIGQGVSFIIGVFVQIWSSGKALVDVMSLLVITPVVAFYLLLDWDNMVAKLDSWVPRDYLATVRDLASQMNDAIAGFVRGQGTICLILAIFYGSALSAAGLNFGLLIGIMSGVISFVPYLGSLLGFMVSIGIALVQFWPNYPWVILIAGIFLFGQFMDGYILQPKLIGEKVGLHPVWLMFSLLAFGALFGFVGLMVAVPTSASIAVLVRYAISRYLESDLYHGVSGLEAPEEGPAVIAVNKTSVITLEK